jgi:hypothetical protein
VATVTIEDQKAFLAFLEGHKEHLFEIISLLIGFSLMKDASYFSQKHKASMSKCLDVFEALFLSVLDEETKQQKRLSESPIENDGLGEKLHKNISNAAELVVEKVVSSLKKAIIS